ncbi:hypothetical protein Dimus_001348 [Dionaea muscipula]
MSDFFIEQDLELDNKDGKKFVRTVRFIVHFKEESRETTCNCRLFKSKRMVCTHMIVVWTRKKLIEVPEKFILQRWRKDVLRTHTKVRVSYIDSERKPEWVRYDKFLKVFKEEADKVICSKVKSDRMEAALKSLVEECDGWGEEGLNMCRTVRVPNVGCVGDPSRGTKRGRPVTKRKQSVFEQKSKKKAKSNNTVQLQNNNANNVQVSILLHNNVILIYIDLSKNTLMF